jgi:hypothetical protein
MLSQHSRLLIPLKIASLPRIVCRPRLWSTSLGRNVQVNVHGRPQIFRRRLAVSDSRRARMLQT